MKPRTAAVLDHLQWHARHNPDPFVCNRVLQMLYGWRIDARVHELRQEGYAVVKRVCRCERCQKHSTRVYARALIEQAEAA